jgi:hypothetical protein
VTTVRTEVTDRVVGELAKIRFFDIRKAVAWGKGIAVTDRDGATTIAKRALARWSFAEPVRMTKPKPVG